MAGQSLVTLQLLDLLQSLLSHLSRNLWCEDQSRLFGTGNTSRIINLILIEIVKLIKHRLLYFETGYNSGIDESGVIKDLE